MSDDRDEIPVPRRSLLGSDTAAFVDAVRSARPEHAVWHVRIGVDRASVRAFGWDAADWRAHAIELGADALIVWALDRRTARVVATLERSRIERLVVGTWPPMSTVPRLLSMSRSIPGAWASFAGTALTLILRNGPAAQVELVPDRTRGSLTGQHADVALRSLRTWLRQR